MSNTNIFYDDGIDDVTLRLCKFSDCSPRHTVGNAGDEFMYHIQVEYCKCSWLKSTCLHLEGQCFCWSLQIDKVFVMNGYNVILCASLIVIFYHSNCNKLSVLIWYIDMYVVCPIQNISFQLQGNELILIWKQTFIWIGGLISKYYMRYICDDKIHNSR